MFIFYIFMGFTLYPEIEFLCPNKDIFVFDLDNTLHPMEDQINMKTEECIIRYLKEEKKLYDVENLIDSSRATYSTVLKFVLMKELLSYDEYLNHVFTKVDYDGILRKEESIIKLLESIDKPLFIMSNGTKAHVKKTLEVLGIKHLFCGVFYLGYECNNHVGKPDRRAYELVQKMTNAKKIHFFDDKKKNTIVAQSLGWNCYVADYGSIHELVKLVLAS